MRKISKALREKVKKRFDGRCGYCGQWSVRLHIDHIHPIASACVYNGDINAEENLMPACPACNNYKISFDLEYFRKMISDQINLCRRYSVNFRTAERFGLVSEIKKPIKFYFEEQAP